MLKTLIIIHHVNFFRVIITINRSQSNLPKKVIIIEDNTNAFSDRANYSISLDYIRGFLAKDQIFRNYFGFLCCYFSINIFN